MANLEVEICLYFANSNIVKRGGERHNKYRMIFDVCPQERHLTVLFLYNKSVVPLMINNPFFCKMYQHNNDCCCLLAKNIAIYKLNILGERNL